ncbi:DnaB-like helicase C-terminal domain-containing protein [Brucella inopinata]|uniref:DnaB-like helicase C-terminal domain-containing protein n=1 Tax=Brucella inopinata TaxID=1218315 RepID=UPI000870DD4C|nr:DnaB-like helicase C-terminal domain-containing protein [Brucella inopinata]SCD25492.1 hypothetical protein BR141012304_21033 [Brucella inopinata]
MGKTTVALSTALKVAKAGHGVGFISLEMDADKLAARAVTDLAYDWKVKIPYQDVITGRASIEELDAIESAARQINNLPLIIEEQSGLSMTDIRDPFVAAAFRRAERDNGNAFAVPAPKGPVLVGGEFA